MKHLSMQIRAWSFEIWHILFTWHRRHAPIRTSAQSVEKRWYSNGPQTLQYGLFAGKPLPKECWAIATPIQRKMSDEFHMCLTVTAHDPQMVRRKPYSLSRMDSLVRANNFTMTLACNMDSYDKMGHVAHVYCRISHANLALPSTVNKRSIA